MNIVPEWSAPTAARSMVVLREEDVNPGSLPTGPRWLQQVHGIRVADLDQEAGIPEADAAMTCKPGVVCAIRTADCVPVLLAAMDGTAVGAAHAGWRGLAAGVLEATVGAMRQRTEQDTPLVAWLGPAISAAHFEVGDEVRAAFMARDPAASAAFAANARGRWQCDLYLLARQRLQACGVNDVGGGGLCTYADAARFPSYRRDVQHEKKPTTGRMATLIWLESAP
jgi:polyphenol oxidase